MVQALGHSPRIHLEHLLSLPGRVARPAEPLPAQATSTDLSTVSLYPSFGSPSRRAGCDPCPG